MSPATSQPTAGGQLTIHDCQEYGYVDVAAPLWLSAQHETVLNSDIDGRDVIRATFRDGQLRLQATSYVGLIPVNEQLVIRVHPRVPLANLTRMVIDTGHSVLPLTAFRDYSKRGTADDWAMDLYVAALLDYVDQILDQGLARAHIRREDEGDYPHGRIDIRRTLQRFAARGVANKASYAWFERTTDTPANQCILAAMELAHAHLSKFAVRPRKGDREKLARLSGQLIAFSGITPDAEASHMRDPQILGLTPFPDSRSYYRPVLDLCLLMLGGMGIDLELGGHDVRLGSLLVDTNDLFEKFVRVSLRKYADKHEWPVDVLNGNESDGSVALYDVPQPAPTLKGAPLVALATKNRGRAQPDIVLKHSDGRYLLTGEIKNTLHGVSDSKDTLPDRSEVEQAVTYALRYGLPFTLLVHPWTGGSKGLVYVGRVNTIDVYDYRLDLSVADELDDSIDDLGQTLAILAGFDAQASSTG